LERKQAFARVDALADEEGAWAAATATADTLQVRLQNPLYPSIKLDKLYCITNF